MRKHPLRWLFGVMLALLIIGHTKQVVTQAIADYHYQTQKVSIDKQAASVKPTLAVPQRIRAITRLKQASVTYAKAHKGEASASYFDSVVLQKCDAMIEADNAYRKQHLTLSKQATEAADTQTLQAKLKALAAFSTRIEQEGPVIYQSGLVMARVHVTDLRARYTDELVARGAMSATE